MTYLIDVTSQFLATAALQILLPKNPFPPQTTIFLLADADAAAVEAIVAGCGFAMRRLRLLCQLPSYSGQVCWRRTCGGWGRWRCRFYQTVFVYEEGQQNVDASQSMFNVQWKARA